MRGLLQGFSWICDRLKQDLKHGSALRSPE
jgi:hypothetical protein